MDVGAAVRMRDEIIAEWTGILHMIVEQTVPERKEEIEGLWHRYQPPLHEVGDIEGVKLEADADGIRFARKDLQCLWLLGFSAWKSVALYSPAILLAALQNDTVLNILGQDDDASALERDYFERMRAVEKFVAERSVDPDHWPPDIPEPVIQRSELNDNEGRMMFDVVNYATAGIFLHELRHVMFRRDKNGPKPYSDEERQCDAFALDVMIAKLADHAEAAKIEYATLLSKRAFGLAVMALFLQIITPVWERGGSKDYPPLGERLYKLLQIPVQDEHDHYWMFVACVSLAEARRAHLDLSSLAPGLSFAGLARSLLMLLNPQAADV